MSTPSEDISQGRSDRAAGSPGLVLRNAMVLVVGRAVAMPLAIVVNAIMARYLGPAEFGHFYLASTLTGFAFLFVAWGQEGSLPANVARDRSRSGEFLGSALAWRVSTAPIVYGVLAAGSFILGYAQEVQIALALVSATAALNALTGACLETIRGFERTDVTAYAQAAYQLLVAVLMVPVLALGGRLPAALSVFLVVSFIQVFAVRRVLRPIGVGRLVAKLATVRRLATEGWPFLVFGLTLGLQPNVDAVFLSKLAPTEVIGWLAAANKLIGALCIPSTALLGALYPTLCRLRAEDDDGFRRTAQQALTTSTVLVTPLAVACGLYAEVGVGIFGGGSFGPTVLNLRVLAPFVFLVYFTMTLGVTLLAAGRQREWAVVQLLSVSANLVLDPLLIPFFQRWAGNGGLGVCVATLVSESWMLAAGVWLAPRGLLDRSVGRLVMVALASGGVMAAVALLTSGWSPFLAAPIAVLAYVACLRLLGGLDDRQVAVFREMVGRRRGV